MKKIFNLRPIVVGFISLIFTVLVTANYMLNKTIFNLILLIAGGVLLAVNIFFVVYFIAKNNTKNFKFITLCLVLILSVASVIFSVLYLLPVAAISGKYSLIAEVESVKVYDNSIKLNLKDLNINNTEVNGSCELVVFNYGEENSFNVGDKISTMATVSTITKNYDNLNYVINNINYKATTSVYNVEVYGFNNSIKNNITLNIKQNLLDNLNYETAQISYSVLFGERENMSDIFSVFNAAGIAHVLAVSGLHVGFLVAIIFAILKFLKCNKWVITSVMFTVLLLYAYLCGFTASVVRAAIMSMVLLVSKMFGKEYDAVSSLSLAGIIILMFNLMSVYSAGFQLSFGCVFAIITLTKPLKIALEKIKLPKFLIEPLTISLAVNLGVLTITAKHFSQISFISVFSNLLVLPLFAICYGFLFVICLLGLILPFINSVLIIPNIMLHFIKLIANFFANIKFLTFTVFKFSYLFVILTILILYFIGFALVNKKFKMVVSGVVISALILGIIVTNLPTVFTYNSGYTANVSSGNFVFLTEENNNKVLILNQTNSINNVVEKLNDLKVNKVNSLVVNNYSTKYNSQIVKLIEKYEIDTMFIENSCVDIAYQTFSKTVFVKSFNKEFNIGNIRLETYYFNTENVAISFEINNNKVLMLNDNVSKTEINNLSYEVNNFNYLIYNDVQVDISQTNLNFNKEIKIKAYS